MPERLIGGVLISRIDVARLPLLDEAADGALRLTHPTAATCTGHVATGGAGVERGEIAERPGADGEGGVLRGKHGRSAAWSLWVAHLEVLGALLLLLAIAAQPESQRALERALELWGAMRRYAEIWEV